MQPHKKSNRQSENLANLEDLGFGPESILMTDPKLFLDRAFLSIVAAEFAQELGTECSRQALIEIGRHHGLSDANRTLGVRSLEDSNPIPREAPGGPNLAMQFGEAPCPSGDFVLRGTWPECHEATARLSRLGPSATPSCHLSAGYTAGWLAEFYDAEVQVVEIACRASEADHCQFEARLTSLGSDHAPVPLVHSDLESHLSESPSGATHREEPHDHSPLDPAESFLPEATDNETELFSHVDPENDSVHAWGPVMVVPFGDPEIAEAAVHALEKDSFAQDIRAVIIDLRGQAIEPNQGFVSIERILKTIDHWQAQVIFAGVADANRDILKTFDSSCPMGQEKLSEAIALGFRIAEAQRCSV